MVTNHLHLHSQEQTARAPENRPLDQKEAVSFSNQKHFPLRRTETNWDAPPNNVHPSEIMVFHKTKNSE